MSAVIATPVFAQASFEKRVSLARDITHSLRFVETKSGIQIVSGSVSRDVPVPIETPVTLQSRPVDARSFAITLDFHSTASSYGVILLLINNTSKWLWSGSLDYTGPEHARWRWRMDWLDTKPFPTLRVAKQYSNAASCGAIAALSEARLLSKNSHTLEKAKPSAQGLPLLDEVQTLRSIPNPGFAKVAEGPALWSMASDEHSDSNLLIFDWRSEHWPIPAFLLEAKVQHPAGHLLFVDQSGRGYQYDMDTSSPFPLWLEAQTALSTRCIALFWQGAGSFPYSLRALSQLHASGGLQLLIEALDAPGSRGSEAARILDSWDDALIPSLKKHWPQLSTRARRRLIPVLARRATQQAEALDLLAELAEASDLSLAHRAFAAIEALPPENTLEALLLLIKHDAPTQEQALRSIARHPSKKALPFLVKYLFSADNYAKPTVRKAIRSSCAQDISFCAQSIEESVARDKASPPARAVSNLGTRAFGHDARYTPCRCLASS
ncbi:MAG: HEAT repeat domain-containing protein [Myxococcales bacterium]|nr:MAG: HEAT repeat domain-containing protein [Myxococcales bacterium]